MACSFASTRKYIRGKDTYNVIENYFKEINLPLEKLVSITTDGAAVMIGSGFVIICKKDAEFPDFLHYHCITHQQAL